MFESRSRPSPDAALANEVRDRPPGPVGSAGPSLPPSRPALPPLAFRLEGADRRERSLPVRQGDLTRLLLAEPCLSSDDRSRLAQFGRILGALFHSEFHDRLRELKELYAPLDPDSDYVWLHEHSLARSERSDEDFMSRLESTLEKANYRPLPLALIEQAISTPNEAGLTYQPDFSLFEHIKVYVRGHTQISRECRNLTTRFRRRQVSFDAYQRMVVALKFRPDKDLGPLVRSDVVYLRMFKDVPHVDMEMHLPEQGTRVRMRWIDRVQIASPLFTGLPALIAKLLVAATLSPMLLGGLIIAPISAGVRSFLGYQNSKRKHLYSMIHRLYYLTIANNASLLTRLIDSAEDEEYKESMLAYYFLWRAADDPEPPGTEELDRRIEAFLLEKTGVEVNFEVRDAVRKLQRLGLADHDARQHLRAVPLDQALTKLDRLWDETFRFT